MTVVTVCVVKLRWSLPASLVTVIAALLLAPASGSAYVVGIADQSPQVFDNPFL